MNRRVGLTGISTNAPGRFAGTKYYPRAANSLPPLPGGSVLKPSYSFHPSLHKFRSIEHALLFVNTAAALVIAFFLLFAPL